MPSEQILPPPQSGPRWRGLVRHVLKYSLLTFLFAILCATAWTWNRSHLTADRLHIEIAKDHCIVLGSKDGEILIGKFNVTKTPSNNWEGARIVANCPLYSFPAHDPDEFYHEDTYSYDPKSGFESYRSKFGFGVVRRFDNGRYMFKGSLTVSYAPSYYWSNRYNGLGILFPHWLLLLMSGSLFSFILLGRRFSLRLFLIWITVVCVILAIAVNMGK